MSQENQKEISAVIKIISGFIKNQHDINESNRTIFFLFLIEFLILGGIVVYMLLNR